MPGTAIKATSSRPPRLHRSAEYRAVYQGGRRWPQPHFVLFARPAPPQEHESRVGITTSRQLGGAVARNRLRRRLREVIRRNWRAAPAGWHLVINPRREAAGATFAALEAEWRQALARLGAPPGARPGMKEEKR